MSGTTALPLSDDATALLALPAVGLLVFLVYAVLVEMRGERAQPVWERWQAGWLALALIGGALWLALFVLVLAAAYTGTRAMITDPTSAGLGLGALLVALLGAPFLIWTTVLKDRTVRFQKEGHMTDRISKAVEQLGAEKMVKESLRSSDPKSVYDKGGFFESEKTEPNLEVRIGAILSLERIAQDSTEHDRGRDHVRVMEILRAYVRENAKAGSLESGYDQERPFKCRIDIQIALDVIKRRTNAQIQVEENAKYRIDLRNCDLRGSDLSNGIFRGAILAECRLEYSQMRNSDFSGALFERSVINFIYCPQARFIGANLHHVRLDKPARQSGGLVATVHIGDLTGASFIGADITALPYLRGGAEATFGTKDTKLGDDLDGLRQEANQLRGKYERAKSRNNVSEAQKLHEALVQNPFSEWIPYDSADLSTGPSLAEFRERLSLTGWPYENIAPERR